MELHEKILRTPDGLKDAFLIREEVFIKEQGFQNEFDELDKISWHAVVYDKEIPVACGRIFVKRDTLYAIGRVAVRKEYRGKNLGQRVMECLERQAKQLGAERIELSAQCQAQAFYRKMGYEAEGDIYLDEHCPHIRMYKIL